MKSDNDKAGSGFDFDRQSQWLALLEQLLDSTAEAELAAVSAHSQAVSAAQVQHLEQRGQLADTYQEKCAEIRADYENDREAAIFDYESDTYELVRHHEEESKRFEEERAVESREAEQRFKAALKAADESHLAARTRAKRQLAAARQHDATLRETLLQTETQTRQLLRRRRCPAPTDDLASAAQEAADNSGTNRLPPMRRYDAALQQMRAMLHELKNHSPARFLEQQWPLLIFVLTWLTLAYPAALLFEFNAWIWPVVTTISAATVALVVRQSVRPFVLKRAGDLYPQVREQALEGLAALQAALDEAEAERRRINSQADQQREAAIEGAKQLYAQRQAALEQSYRERVEQQNQAFQTKSRELLQTRDRRWSESEAWLPANLDPLAETYRAQLQQLDTRHERQLQELQQQFDLRWAGLVERWRGGVAEFQASIESVRRFCENHFPSWSDPQWDSFQAPEHEPPVIPFGRHEFDVQSLEAGQPRHEKLQLEQRLYELPAALRLPERPSLLLEADGPGRDRAVAAIQNVMLRLLTSLPPGKVRFTIVDPVGLGQNFSAFMHLADFDEKLVASRIWTETAHIQKRLTDLTEHMENVIQKYLRNEFASIHDYNRHAGEVAEAFQILVIANFPAGFNDEAARRLTSIASSGARCGVYTLISVDTKLRLPRNFDLSDLEKHAATLRWDGKRFYAMHPRMKQLPLKLDTPPGDERFTGIIRSVGRLAKDASRVEVPFDSVVAPLNEWWSGDSRHGIEVPLGRAGATKLQYLRLGSGTSQHVLISGKTGSGKSTLLNAMITNLAIWYGPEELEFYLIDFKKGVEFKPYATHALPHARVIAIESEREFGMSVLERLDAELRIRGDLFRKHGVQNLSGFREANPDTAMPRLLLIIDEFQEFFVKDDKIAADAALLLDRLVRQGRAFGIHVLLGSQTLAGAYSLARSTIGQMAVRIALQCSESDAHLILSEENTAARLLSRPGEAIYNDANGLFEGNHPFQIVWLSDSEREHHLERLSKLARVRAPQLAPPIVFEGNQPADPRENQLLAELLSGSGEPAGPPRAWLGSAVAIKEPTSLAFQRQAGNNLLVVGPQEELAVGVLANGVLCLAAQGPPFLENGSETSSAFVVLDGLRPESALAGCWRRMAAQFPVPIEVASGRQAMELIEELAAEVARRHESGDESGPPRFLIVANLARFRELQRGDDFGFSSFGEEEKPDPGKQFRAILRDGPAVGVHALIWADSFSSASRWLDRQSFQDLDHRVLFQMGVSDSSNLMDSTAASTLGPYRAILYSHELGEWEKFRPYAFPATDWLNEVAGQLRRRQADVPSA